MAYPLRNQNTESLPSVKEERDGIKQWVIKNILCCLVQSQPKQSEEEKRGSVFIRGPKEKDHYKKLNKKHDRLSYDEDFRYSYALLDLKK